jgi:hypothetical protein
VYIFLKKKISLSIIYIMPNAWVEHIKKYAKVNNVSYGCAYNHKIHYFGHTCVCPIAKIVIKKQMNKKQMN